MSTYFKYFPNTIHNQKLLRDITRRVDFTQTSLADPYLFLPFTIQEGEKPEDVAYYYYGDVKYTWLVYLSAGVIDPYKDWPLDNQQFHSYIIKKYAVLADATGNVVLNFTQNTNLTRNILYYKNVNDGTIISKDSYTLDPNIVQGDWRAIRIYEYESELNESKRVISLIDERYKEQAEKELKELLDV